MKVAVTGALGFIGRHLLEDPAHEWVSLSRGQAPGRSGHVQTDYSTEHLARVFAGVDAVVHLASAKMTAGDREEILHENVRLAHAVYSACESAGTRRLVDVSSRMVYGPSDPMPWRETDDAHPTTFYGLSKLCAEKLEGVCLGPDSPCTVVHLRFPQVLGVPGSGVDDHAITQLLTRASRGEDLVVTRNTKRQYLHVDDAAASIIRALEPDAPRGVFNVAIAEPVSLADAAREISSAFADSPKVAIDDPATEVPVEVLMDVASAEFVLGFVPGRSFRDAIHDIGEELGV